MCSHSHYIIVNDVILNDATTLWVICDLNTIFYYFKHIVLKTYGHLKQMSMEIIYFCRRHQTLNIFI